MQVGYIRVDVLFSSHPKRDRNHGLNLLAKQLEAAKNGIDMALFVFSAHQLTNLLREQIKQGVEIRLVLRAAPSRKYSICWESLFQITPARWKLATNPLIRPYKGSAPRASCAATSCITNSP